MTEKEILEQILLKVTHIETDVAELKTDVANLKMDVAELKTDAANLKMDVAGLKTDVTDLKEGINRLDTKLTDTRLHIENVTDKNIQILAENHLTLINKFNQNVSVADKNLIYEIQVRVLTEKVEILEKEMKELKEKIA